MPGDPIPTRGDRLCPPNYYWHTLIFRPSNGPANGRKLSILGKSMHSHFTIRYLIHIRLFYSTSDIITKTWIQPSSKTSLRYCLWYFNCINLLKEFVDDKPQLLMTGIGWIKNTIDSSPIKVWKIVQGKRSHMLLVFKIFLKSRTTEQTNKQFVWYHKNPKLLNCDTPLARPVLASQLDRCSRAKD